MNGKQFFQLQKHASIESSWGSRLKLVKWTYFIITIMNYELYSITNFSKRWQTKEKFKEIQDTHPACLSADFVIGKFTEILYINIGLWSIIRIHKHIHRYKHQVCIYLRRSQSIAEKKHFCSFCLATICTFCLLHTWLEAGKLRSQVPPHHSAACFPICRIALYLQCSCAFLQSGCYSSIPGVQIYWLLNWLPVLQNCLTG